MKILALLALSLVCASFLPAQSYVNFHRSMRMVEEEMLEGHYSNSLDTLQSMNRKYSFPFWRDAFVAAECAALNGSPEITFDYLQKAVKGGMTLKPIRKQVLLRTALDGKQLKFLKKVRKDFECQSINESMRKTLLSMFSEDQRIRQGKFSQRSPSEFRKADSLNSLAVKSFILEYGYPGPTLVGDASPKLFLLIWHGIASAPAGQFYSDSVRARLWKEVEQGRLSIIEFARMEDRSHPGTTIYGSIGTGPLLEKDYLEKYASKIDSARIAIGLGTLELRNRKRADTRNLFRYSIE